MRMKLSAASVGLATTAPALLWAWRLLAQTVDNVQGVEPSSLLNGLSSMGFAGLVWYLLAVRDPKREQAQAEEREKYIQRMDRHDEMHTTRLKEIVDTLGTRLDRNSDLIDRLVTESQQLRMRNRERNRETSQQEH